ncbi:hypothetical protein [Mesorhizobium sp. 131-2-1]|uniref:hypothetical protein n=1 Tax=Mesorhizobium sp. 131-2-1 TaxID=2744518 RepID=UPI001929370A|nr:hypothetical protein [Mesorhizobium sp. 131-2-1]BCG94375.1 hypothetical protein MesoLj131a_32390 [Mesorhizobium sp. 131-2-1]
MTEDRDFLCFNDLRYGNDVAAGGLRAIAEVLRSGSPSETFLALLADHIDPDVKTSLTGAKLVIKRSRKPKDKPNYELRNYVHTHCCIFDENREAVLNAAQKKFGIRRTVFFEALKAVQVIQENNPDLFAELAASAWAKREGNDPEFQPVR